ncbi:MDR family MFS transporter [Bacillus gobiensis]|uniref:MDR family MFS transporter n=1 Tax=Bacillus gobiensis TaxID=1441095 RepID=UPI003D1EBED7
MNQKTNNLPIVIVLLTGTFIAILNQTLLTTAIPHIMNDLKIDANMAQWLTTAFLLVNGIMIPITAFLIEKFTTRKLFISAMSLFAIGTLICATAPSFPVIIIGRVIQAAGAGIVMPLMQTVFILIFPKDKRGSAMGMVGLVIAFAPAIGPTLSGWIVDNYAWETIFYILLPFTLINIGFAYFILRNVTEQTNPKVDVLSIILSSVGFGGILYGFSVAGGSGWGSMEVLGSFFVGGLSLFLFIWRQLHLPHPILEFRVFQYKIFTLSTVIGMILFMAMLGAATIMPMYMQNMRHFSAMESGMMLLPGAIAMGILSPVTGKIFDKIGPKILSVVGLSLVTLTSILMTNLTESTPFLYMSIVYAFRMMGLGIVLMPITTAGLNVLPRHLIPHGTAMNNTMRQIAGSIGTALLITIMTQGAHTAANAPSTELAMIHGVNLAFVASTIISAVGLILTFFIQKDDSNRYLKEKKQKLSNKVAFAQNK